MNEDYIIKEIEINKLEEYVNLFKKVFNNKEKFNIDYLKWLYQNCPYGNVIGFDAICNDEIVAHYAILPIKYNYEGRIYNGALSLNTATHPNHQGRGLFTKLAKHTYDKAKILKLDFIIGIANQNSTHGFINKLGFILLGKIELYFNLYTNNDSNNNAFGCYYSKEWIEWKIKNPNNLYYFEIKSNIINLVTTKFYNLIKINLLNNVDNKLNKYKFERIINKKFLISITPFFSGKEINKIKLPSFLKKSPLNVIFLKLNNELEDDLLDKLIINGVDLDTF